MKKPIKQLLFAAAAIMLTGSCSEAIYDAEPIPAGTATLNVQENWADSVDAYKQQIRTGDAMAYLSLAHCYHKGLGVKHDFVDMLMMVAMAQDYGVRNAMELFTSRLNADDPDYIQLMALDDVAYRRYDEAMEKAALLGSLGSPAAEFVTGVVAMERHDREEAMRLFRLSAGKGNKMARIAISKYESEDKGWLSLAGECPVLYNEVARDCFKSDVSPQEDAQAAYYYQKAYDALCLDPTGARWLLGYYQHTAQKGGQGADSTLISNLRQMVKKYEERRLRGINESRSDAN